MNDGPNEWSAVRHVAAKGALLLLPFGVLLALELFVLPLDTFTFRVWEAALATPYRYPGPFYPNLSIKKPREYGDFYRRGEPARVQSKPVTWYTDNYGWRNRPEVEAKPKYDIVVLGDSNIVGTFLDQKDTIGEALQRRSGFAAYSYAIAHDHISLFFSDRRMVEKAPDLIVVESKVINWMTNDSYLANFRQRSDGTLDVVDRTSEFEGFYDSSRNRWVERVVSQWSKQAMFHWLKAALATSFKAEVRDNRSRIAPIEAISTVDDPPGWKPGGWTLSGGEQKVPLADEPNVLHMRATSPGAYWHTDPFRARRADGVIAVRFQARNSIGPSRNKLYVFEDGSYRMVGEVAVTKHWQTYEIAIKTNRGSSIELQIDLPDDWQWFSLRDFRVQYAKDDSVPAGPSVSLPLTDWVPAPAACAGAGGLCGRWERSMVGAYVQTPALPEVGPAGILLQFEARTDVPATDISRLYLFEGSDYRQVAQYAYTTEWRQHSLLIRPRPGTTSKVQIDIPLSVQSLLVRNASVTPLRYDASE